MEICRPTDLTGPGGETIPALLVEDPRHAASTGLVWFHEFAGSKLQSAGTAVVLAERGFPTLVPDLRGHGEHPAPFDAKVLEEARAAVAWMRKRHPRVGALGLSLGGLLAGASRADFAVLLGPPIVAIPSPEGQYMLKISSHEVRQSQPGVLGPVMAQLIGELPSGDPSPLRILYAAGEPPDIVNGIEAWAGAHRVPVTKVTASQVPDLEGPPGLVRYLPRWLNHTGLAQVALSSELLSAALKDARS